MFSACCDCHQTDASSYADTPKNTEVRADPMWLKLFSLNLTAFFDSQVLLKKNNPPQKKKNLVNILADISLQRAKNSWFVVKTLKSFQEGIELKILFSWFTYKLWLDIPEFGYSHVQPKKVIYIFLQLQVILKWLAISQVLYAWIYIVLYYSIPVHYLIKRQTL